MLVEVGQTLVEVDVPALLAAHELLARCDGVGRTGVDTDAAVGAEVVGAERRIDEQQPAAGQTYLQLVATAKAEADVMVDLLHQKNFKAIAVQIPEKPALYRILVGPLADGTLNKTKSDLQSSGFPGDKAIKKVY